MKQVYTTHDPILVGYLSSVLDEHGIGCMIRNQLLSGGVGGLPPTECWPEIWVLDDKDEANARAVIELALAQDQPRQKPWICPGCGEQAEPQFAACWKCGASRPGMAE